jgi:hypothetical protein
VKQFAALHGSLPGPLAADPACPLSSRYLGMNRTSHGQLNSFEIDPTRQQHPETRDPDQFGLPERGSSPIRWHWSRGGYGATFKGGQ